NRSVAANGSGFFDMIDCDLNHNVAERAVVFQVRNAVSGSLPSTPGLFPISVTTGQSLGLFTTQRVQRFSDLRSAQDPHLVKLGSRSINLLTAPSNATLYVEVQWTNVGAVVYTVLRSFTGGGCLV